MNARMCIAAWIAACGGAACAQDWSTLARGASRIGTTAAVDSIAAARWVASQDDLGQPITFDGQTTVIMRLNRVYALGKSAGVNKLFCMDAVTGAVQWGAPVPAPVLESWASPTLDQLNGVVLVASGRFVTAISAGSGSQLWQTELDRSTAGATCAVTDDQVSRNRAFITDYDGFGNAGKLYCINIDAMTAANPFQRGQIVWSVVIGTTSANTPAYQSGVVYVANVGEGSAAGVIRAFPATATSAPPPLWTFTNIVNAGFFGGLSVTSQSGILAASYTFAGGPFSANLVSLQPSTGTLRWSIPCNRTDSIPVRLPDESVIVSGGIRGFGTIPSVQKFRDMGTSALLLWDSAVDSWVDTNSNQQMDPGEYIDVGGWTVQPMAAGQRLCVGVLPNGSSTSLACGMLRMVDPFKTPSESGFIVESYTGAGSSPSGGFGSLYTIGPGGVHALGARPCYANCDQSTAAPILNALDFACFLSKFGAGETTANCDGSTAAPILNALDFQCMINQFAAGCGP